MPYPDAASPQPEDVAAPIPKCIWLGGDTQRQPGNYYVCETGVTNRASNPVLQGWGGDQPAASEKEEIKKGRPFSGVQHPYSRIANPASSSDEKSRGRLKKKWDCGGIRHQGVEKEKKAGKSP